MHDDHSHRKYSTTTTSESCKAILCLHCIRQKKEDLECAAILLLTKILYVHKVQKNIYKKMKNCYLWIVR